MKTILKKCDMKTIYEKTGKDRESKIKSYTVFQLLNKILCIFFLDFANFFNLFLNK